MFSVGELGEEWCFPLAPSRPYILLQGVWGEAGKRHRKEGGRRRRTHHPLSLFLSSSCGMHGGKIRQSQILFGTYHIGGEKV